MAIDSKFLKPVGKSINSKFLKPLSKGEGLKQKVLGFIGEHPFTPLLWDENGKPQSIARFDSPAHIGGQGLDISAPHGTKVQLPKIKGTVVKVVADRKPRDGKDYGNHVIIEDGNVRYTLGHFDKINVKEGDTVNPYDVIGTVGNTGQVYGATGYHLHIDEVIDGKKSIGPDILSGLEGSLPPQVMEDFKNKDLTDVRNYLPAISEFDPSLAKELTPSTFKIISDRLQEDLKVATDFAKTVIDQPLESLGKGAWGLLKLPVTIAQYTAEQGIDIGRASVGMLKAIPDLFETVQIVARGLQEGRGFNEKFAVSSKEQEAITGIEQPIAPGLKAIAGGTSLIPWATTQAVSGFAEQLGEAQEKGLPTKVGVAEGLVSGAERGSLMFLLEKLTGSPRTVKARGLAKDAEKAGISPQDFNAIVEAKKAGATSQELRTMLDNAVKSSTSRQFAVEGAPTAQLSKILANIRNQLEQKTQQQGKKVGELRQGLPKQKIDLTQTKQNFVDEMLERFNVDIKKGKLNFKDSRLKDFPGEQAFLKKIWQGLQKGKMDTRAADEFASGIGDKLSKGSATKEFSIAQGLAQKIKTNIQEAVDSVAKGNFQVAKSKYSELKQLRNDLTKAIGEEGQKGVAPIRALFTPSATGGTTRSLLQRVQDFAKEYKIKEGQNLGAKADVAIATERIAATPTAKQSLGEVMANVAERPSSLVSSIRSLKEPFFPSPKPVPTARTIISKATPATRVAPISRLGQLTELAQSKAPALSTTAKILQGLLEKR